MTDGTGEDDKFGVGTNVAQLYNPTKEPVQTITLSEKAKARFVTLLLHRKFAYIRFREVEIYDGPLVGNSKN